MAKPNERDREVVASMLRAAPGMMRLLVAAYREEVERGHYDRWQQAARFAITGMTPEQVVEQIAAEARRDGIREGRAQLAEARGLLERGIAVPTPAPIPASGEWILESERWERDVSAFLAAQPKAEPAIAEPVEHPYAEIVRNNRRNLGMEPAPLPALPLGHEYRPAILCLDCSAPASAHRPR